MRMMTRRQFLTLAGLTIPGAIAADACIEPGALRVTRLDFNPAGKLRLVHFSDFHYKGDAEFATEVVRTINDLAPDVVVFTGDMVEEGRFAPAALEFIRQIKRPVYGAPGNHEYRSGISFPALVEAFAATGGQFMVDSSAVFPEHDLEIVGMGTLGIHGLRPPRAGRRILLNHFPERSDQLYGATFDLILAGHSHGGQVRLPFYGAPILPYGVGAYDHGYFETKGGPLYVNAGIGTYYFPFRFNCRPELTVITF